MYSYDQLNNFLNKFDVSKHEILLDAYYQSLTEQYNKCHTALETQDLNLLNLSMHDIKSLALTIGADDLGFKAQDIEKNVKADNASAAFAEVPILNNYLNNLLDVIRGQLEKRKA